MKEVWIDGVYSDDEKYIRTKSIVYITSKMMQDMDLKYGSLIQIKEDVAATESHMAEIGLLRNKAASEKSVLVSTMLLRNFNWDLGAFSATRICFMEKISCQEMAPAKSVSLQFASSKNNLSSNVQFRGLIKGLMEQHGSNLLNGHIVYRNMVLLTNWRNEEDQFLVWKVNNNSSESPDCVPFTIDDNTELKLSFPKSFGPHNPIQLKHQIAWQVQQKLGGLNQQIEQLLDLILIGSSSFFQPKDSLVAQGEVEESSWTSHGAILTGRSGSGKTALIRSVCTHLSPYFEIISLNSPEIYQRDVGQSEKYLIDLFTRAMVCAPCILVLDELETIASLGRPSSLECRICYLLLSLLDRMHHEHKQVFVIGITSVPLHQLYSCIYSAGRLDTIVDIPTPDCATRKLILRQMLTHSMPHIVAKPDALDVIASRCAGYLASDVLKLCREVILRVSSPEPRLATLEDFVHILTDLRPAVLQKNFEFQTPDVSLSQLKGIESAMEIIERSILFPLREYPRFVQAKVNPPKGVLIHGPEGCGKTTLARAIATAASGWANFLPIQCTDIISKRIGESEKAIQSIFHLARQAAPCIVLFDQIETLAPVRGFDSSTEKTFDRILSTMLIEMDGMMSTSSSSRGIETHVLVLATTTHKRALDPAILRPGRFDQCIQLHEPALEAREAILAQGLEPIPLSFEDHRGGARGNHPWAHISSKAILAREMAKTTSGYSGADLLNICRQVAMNGLRENIHTESIHVSHCQPYL